MVESDNGFDELDDPNEDEDMGVEQLKSKR